MFQLLFLAALSSHADDLPLGEQAQQLQGDWLAKWEVTPRGNCNLSESERTGKYVWSVTVDTNYNDPELPQSAKGQTPIRVTSARPGGEKTSFSEYWLYWNPKSNTYQGESTSASVPAVVSWLDLRVENGRMVGNRFVASKAKGYRGMDVYCFHEFTVTATRIE